MSAPGLSVVIPCYRRREMLESTLTSVLEQSAAPADYEILLVDNGSGDGTYERAVELARRHPGRVRAFLETERGAASARNRGAAEAAAERILFLDDDMLASRELVARHIAAHRTHAGSVLGFIETAWSDRPDPFLRFLHESELQNTFPFADGETVSFKFFYTGNVSVRREVFLRVGGFDRDYRRYGVEDIDLGYRLEMEGEPLLFDRGAVAVHRYDPTYREFAAKRATAARSLAYFLDKYPHLLRDAGFERNAFRRLFPRMLFLRAAAPFILAGARRGRLGPWQRRYYAFTVRWGMYQAYRLERWRLGSARRRDPAAYLG